MAVTPAYDFQRCTNRSEIPQRRPRPTLALLGREEGGQSLIEMAIIMPLVLIVMAGLFDFGRVIHSYVVVVNAAREAAIAGAVEEMSDSDLTAYINEELERGGVNRGTSASIFSYADKGTPAVRTLIVELSYEVPLVISILPFSTVTVESRAEMITFW